MGLACRDAYSRLLTWSSLRSPGVPGVGSSSLRLVGRLHNGRVAALCCVRGYGRRRAWRTMLSPTHGMPFPFRLLHARLVWCWPACVWSVYCQLVHPPPHAGFLIGGPGNWAPPPSKSSPYAIIYDPHAEMKHIPKVYDAAPLNDRLKELIRAVIFVSINHGCFES